MRLPALTVAICYVCGLLAGHYTQLTPSLLGATVAAGLPVIYGGRRWGHVPDWFLSLFLCLLLVGSGALWYTIHTRVMPKNHVGRFCDREDPVSIRQQAVWLSGSARPWFRAPMGTGFV